MRGTSLETLRELRRGARERAEQLFAAQLAGVRAAEDHVARCLAREVAHVAGRMAVATARLSALEVPAPPDRVRAHPGLDSPVCRAQIHETRERLLRAEEVLLVFGHQRAALHLAASMARMTEAQALLNGAELRLSVVERFLANRAAADRVRLRRREERERDG